VACCFTATDELMDSGKGMIERLLSFLKNTSFKDLPSEVVHQGKRCLTDWIGVTLGGLKNPSISILIKTVKEFGGKKHATILGTSVKTSVLQAALVNGAMSHVLDFDDTHLHALMHPSAPLLPALFAYGEWKKVKGKDFLLAFVLGFEIETRISMAMGTSHYDLGWHSTATMGRFGAVAGVGKMAGLDRQKMAYALGLAGTQASGIRKVFGTMTKSFHAGKAAADGLLSVLLAQKGYTSPIDILEGEKGLGSLLSFDFDPQRGLEGLGKSYTIMGTSFKPYSSCLYAHPAIYGVIQLRNQHQIKPLDVEAIDCSVSRFCFDAACIKDPQTGLEGKFSTPYCVSLALIEGSAGEDLFRDEALKDQAIRDVMRRVKVEEKPELSNKEAEITVWLRDGKSIKHKVDYPLGDPENPLPDQKLDEKARGLLQSIFEKERVEAILKKLWDLESVGNIEELISLLRKANGQKGTKI
jgi:2-methylcitrate dehydratase PrpD